MLSQSAAWTWWQGKGKSPVNLVTPFTFTIKRAASHNLSVLAGIVTVSFIFAHQACGVDFEVKTYLAKEKSNPDEKIDKKWAHSSLWVHYPA